MSVDVQSLAQKKCKPCEGNTQPFSKAEVEQYVRHLPGWTISCNGKMIRREYVMKDFMAAVQFMNRIAEIAEAEDHHPDMAIRSYRKLTIELATHSIGGLSENDLILAAKIENLPKTLKE